MSLKLAAVLRMVPMTVVMGTIFFLSHQSGDRLSLPPLPGFDKLAHMVAYGVLAGTVIFALSAQIKQTNPRKAMLFTVVFCLLYGVSDEYHQSFISGRAASVYDLFADCGGAVMICLFWAKWRKKKSMMRCW